MKADKGKREELTLWDWAGEGQESFLDRPDEAWCLKGQQDMRTGRRRWCRTLRY